ncbi:uncharacterized protein TRIVIDRAFT_209038 [Trichoderma virens Gv29-8]|uniref:LysM domain-containing protein n=1 Tax=Hypocrea virens (strain Gv29-8 / FGSC 10586) TaxID=413071 RepID=G9MSC9_HYPVG|nr:uncharacterized protein TRIVIDRAFT_209038 [Trichoderma virens Gv29-8]EHK22146.1 hypothetical protein TRIVIDRAFT_209038 [Trichoderma virens Gv29-8]UKZ47177.1 hypothetical protein TrVGV298_001391 [Trichoderma virens]
MSLSVHYLLWSLLLQPFVYSQVLSENAHLHINTGLSAACAAPSYEKVACSQKFWDIAGGEIFTDSSLLSEICTDICLDELKALREKQLSVCKISENIYIDYDVQLPPTYITDLLLYTYHYACMTDPTTGEYCSPDFFKWNSKKEGVTAAELCSDCNLLVQQAHLDSPIGYDPDLASSYSSLTSSCGVTKYPITSQPPYLLHEAMTPTAPSNSPIHTASYESRAHPGLGYDKGPDFHMEESADHRGKPPSFLFPKRYTSKPPQLAPGTADSCKRYALHKKSYRNSTMNECGWTAWLHQLNITQFISWNPSISFDAANPSACTLVPGKRYCISKPATTTGNFSNTTTPSATQRIPSEPPTITYSPDDGSDAQKKLEGL